MPAPRIDFPYRHATRLVNPFQFHVGGAFLNALDHDLAAELLLEMIYRQALRAPGEQRISVNAIAASLKQSTETMRRAARLLVDKSACRSLVRGIELAPDFFDLPWVRRLGDEVDDAFGELLDGYRRCGFPLPDKIVDQPRDARIEAALDIQLSAIELGETRDSRPASLRIVGTVAVLNAVRLAADTELGLRYGFDDTVPPDDLRLPASVRQVADVTGLPTTTVWRHLSAAEKRGSVRRVDGGYLLGDRYMCDPVTSRRSREKIHYVHRVFQDLADGRYTRNRMP